jgi:flagellin-like hook-associated protein FlgL
MKTIIARFTELKDNVSAADSEFEDLDYNEVDKALKSVGISLKDSMG